MKRILAAAVVVLIAAVAALLLFRRGGSQAALETARNFSLLDQDGRYFELYRQKRFRAVVLVTYGVGCPIIEKNLPLLESLRKEFEQKGIGFFLLDANSQDGLEALRKTAEETGITLPILRDAEQSVVSTYGLTRTSEALLIRTSDWGVIYHGAIDDRLTYGSERASSTRQYLRDSITSFLEGESIAVPRTTADGCLLQRASVGPAPTFTGQAGAIIRARCNSCHSAAGRTRPTNLVSFAEVKGWAPMIEEVLLTHRMPPWPLDPDYGKFSEDLSLSPGEERTLLEWIRAGTPRGEGAEPPPPEYVGLLQHSRSEIRIHKSSGVVPASLESRWVYTPLLENAERDIWVHMFKVDPGERQQVHISLYVVPKLPDLSHAEKGLMLEGEKILFRQNLSPWGRKVTAYPEGVAMRIPKGASLLLEQHLYPSSKAEEASVDVLLEEYQGKKPPRELHYDIIPSRSFEIPAGAQWFPLIQTWDAPRDTWVVSFLPHMHLHGISMKAFVTRPGGKPVPLFSEPNYSFTHIRKYTFREPVLIPKGSRVTVTGFFDNSAENPYHAPFDRALHFGPDAEKEEMMDLVLYSLY